MKICVDIGHNLPGVDTGAIGIILEDNLNMAVGTLLIEKLKSAGHEVTETLTLASATKDYGDSLYYRCVSANRDNCELFVSIHHNYFNGLANGVSCFYGSEEGEKYATKITDELEKLGFYNRGAKKHGTSTMKRLKVILRTNMTAVLVECGFCDSPRDMQLWDADKISTAILKAITGQSEADIIKDFSKANIKKIQIFSNSIGILDQDRRGLIIDGIIGKRTTFCINQIINLLERMKKGGV